VAETKIQNDNSNNQVRHSNPATHPLPGSAGVTIVTPASTAPVKIVHGQIPGQGVNVIFDSPA